MNEIIKMCVSHHDLFSESIIDLLNGGVEKDEIIEAVNLVFSRQEDVELLLKFKRHGWLRFNHENPDANEKILTLISSPIMCGEAISKLKSSIGLVEPIALHTRRPSHIYLILNNRNGYYKIGISKNPSCREKTLQSEEPDLEMICTWPGTLDDERHLHEHFKDKRIRGEWFRLEEVDTNYIDGYMNSK